MTLATTSSDEFWQNLMTNLNDLWAINMRFLDKGRLAYNKADSLVMKILTGQIPGVEVAIKAQPEPQYLVKPGTG